MSLFEAIAGADLTGKARSTFAKEIKDLKEIGNYRCTVPVEEWEAIIYEAGGLCCKVVGGTELIDQDTLAMADVFRMDPDPYHARQLNEAPITRKEAQEIAVHELWNVICNAAQSDESRTLAIAG